jgi:hypothetical protein
MDSGAAAFEAIQRNAEAINVAVRELSRTLKELSMAQQSLNYALERRRLKYRKRYISRGLAMARRRRGKRG